jgi:hypothetical protein
MKFVGKVSERIEGSSVQVRLSGTLELTTGAKPLPVDFIVSSQAGEVFDAFGPKGTAVEFDVPAA